MEKEPFFSNPQALDRRTSPAAAAAAEQTFFNLNWVDQSTTEQSSAARFDSALSSLVSSPSSAAAPESFAIRELIGRLGFICNPFGEVSPPPATAHFSRSATGSCYATPSSSPPPPMADLQQCRRRAAGNLVPAANLGPFSADPGFAERAARFSAAASVQFGAPESLSRASSFKSIKAGGGPPPPLMSAAELGKVSEGRSATAMESSASDPITTGAAAGERSSRKRKAAAPAAKRNGKETTHLSPAFNSKTSEEEGYAKRCRSGEDSHCCDKDGELSNSAMAAENGGRQKQEEERDSKPPLEPPKDYIHVRARRGQATDSHSLAERVRREKISERMKFLQDLVPGCNKVTGKAVMLDEIINYVQSLQQQVEFLSMKLATMNPRLDQFNIECFAPEDIHQTRGPLPHSVYSMDAAASASTSYPYAFQPHIGATGQLAGGFEANPLEDSLRRALSALPPANGFTDAASAQLVGFWEDDLHSVVQMGFGQDQECFHGSLPSSHMKIEL